MLALDLAGVRWRKSSYSNGDGNECVEVAFGGGRAAVRDSKDPGGGVLVVAADAWVAFRRECAG